MEDGKQKNENHTFAQQRQRKLDIGFDRSELSLGWERHRILKADQRKTRVSVHIVPQHIWTFPPTVPQINAGTWSDGTLNARRRNQSIPPQTRF